MLFAALCAALWAVVAAAKAKPNLIIIFTDDQDKHLNSTHRAYMPALNRLIVDQGLTINQVCIAAELMAVQADVLVPACCRLRPAARCLQACMGSPALRSPSACLAPQPPPSAHVPACMPAAASSQLASLHSRRCLWRRPSAAHRESTSGRADTATTTTSPPTRRRMVRLRRLLKLAAPAPDGPGTQLVTSCRGGSQGWEFQRSACPSRVPCHRADLLTGHLPSPLPMPCTHRHLAPHPPHPTRHSALAFTNAHLCALAPDP